MAEQPQLIVEAPVPADKPFGARKDQNLRSAFSAFAFSTAESMTFKLLSKFPI